ncbi:histone deacetylase [Vibrio scophthalmi]|uniref:histone deacetylase family protein n=1 Tax=Vibrio scophthalmi TaxID=45658 RepID=UPI002284512E|nr:histone deacetylase [Vibrio scophthalmi]MCY9802178.1 histone deacetylase [Vibrio scophthalmi]
MIPVIYHPIYSQLSLPEGHRYPIDKYRLLYHALTDKMQGEWANRFMVFQPKPLTQATISQYHCSDYIDALVNGRLPAVKMRRIGFPWSEALIERTFTSAGGTWLTTQLAIEQGIAIHLSGGYHHAHYDFGSGFCLINDLVLSAKQALTLEKIDRVLIVDSDVHHGDGTATMCSDDERIITLSFHCDKNFPARKPSSDIDIGFARETQDNEFLEHFYSVVETTINLYRPDVIIYDAGVDIHQDDELGYFNISTQGLYQRDRFILALAQQRHIPIACVVGGGYRSVHRDLVPMHMQLLQASAEIYSG